MATIPYVKPQTVAESSAQNALIQQVNTNTNGLESASSALSTTNGTVTDLQSRIAALESKPSGGSAGLYFGQWGDPNNASKGTAINSGSSGTKIMDFTRELVTPSGCRLVNSSVIVDVTGKWQFSAQCQYTGENNSVRAIFFAQSSASAFPTGSAKYGLLAGPTMDAQATSSLLYLTAGTAVSVYVAHWGGGGTFSVWRLNTNLIAASYIGE